MNVSRTIASAICLLLALCITQASERERIERETREREEYLISLRKPAIDLMAEDVRDSDFYDKIHCLFKTRHNTPILRKDSLYNFYIAAMRQAGFATPSPAQYGKTGPTIKKYLAPIYVKNSNGSFTYNLWSEVNIIGDDYSNPWEIEGLDNQPNATTAITITPKTIKFTFYEDCQLPLEPASGDPTAHVSHYSGVRKPDDPYAVYYGCKSKIAQTGTAEIDLRYPLLAKSKENPEESVLVKTIRLDYTNGSCSHNSHWLQSAGRYRSGNKGGGGVLLPYKFYHVCTVSIDLTKSANKLGITPKELALALIYATVEEIRVGKTDFYRKFNVQENAALAQGFCRVFNFTAEDLQTYEYEQEDLIETVPEDVDIEGKPMTEEERYLFYKVHGYWPD